jgi:hypothetical protein
MGSRLDNIVVNTAEDFRNLRNALWATWQFLKWWWDSWKRTPEQRKEGRAFLGVCDYLGEANMVSLEAAQAAEAQDYLRAAQLYGQMAALYERALPGLRDTTAYDRYAEVLQKTRAKESLAYQRAERVVPSLSLERKQK